jgi:hypothetical protein
MADKKDRARAQLLDLIIEKHKAGVLKWSPREDEDSFDVEVGDYKIHLDQKRSGSRIYYVVWVFDRAATVIDRIDLSEFKEMSPSDESQESFSSAAELIYGEIEDEKAASKLLEAIQFLKSL